MLDTREKEQAKWYEGREQVAMAKEMQTAHEQFLQQLKLRQDEKVLELRRQFERSARDLHQKWKLRTENVSVSWKPVAPSCRSHSLPSLVRGSRAKRSPSCNSSLHLLRLERSRYFRGRQLEVRRIGWALCLCK